MLINGYAYPNIRPEILEDWLKIVTFVSTFSYGMTTSGQLIQLEDTSVVDVANASGVGSLMVLTGLGEDGMFSSQLVSEVLNNPQAQERLMADVLLNLEEKGMYGIDFDFEYVFPENREQYVALVEKAAKILNPKGYLVTVALAPKTSTEQKGLLYEGHDYQGMGRVANYVLLMTYEWGYTYGPPMAVAPINKVREVLDYGVTQIEPSKILMGIPNYGYDWKLPYIKGESKAEKVTNREAVERAARMGVEIQFDPVAQSPHYFYTKLVEGSDPPTYEAHEVWFEDTRSLEAKLALVPEYGLAGISIWNIMYPYF